MNDSKSPENLDRLQGVVDAFVDMSVPHGPDEAANQRLIAALRHEDSQLVETSTPRKQGARTMRRLSGLVAAMLAAVAIGWLILQMSANPRQAFAAMVEQIQNIRTASYVLEMEFEGRPKLVTKTMLMEPNWSRAEVKTDKLDFVNIFNFEESKMLNLLRTDKKAQLVEFEGLPESERQKNFMEQFREMKKDEAEYLGRELTDGVSALKFRYDDQSEHYTLWLDPDDNLPVRVVMTDVENEDSVSARMTMTDFQWNPELDESLFTLEIPEGYETLESSVDVGDKSSDDFVIMLRFFVRINDDRFPDELNLLAMVPKIQQALYKPGLSEEQLWAYSAKKLAYALDRPEIVDMKGEERKSLGLELANPFGNGALYMETTKQTHHWHYQGKGVKQGEADKIVAWWYPKKEKAEAGVDLDTANVLYGDYRIETMPVDELPEKGE